MAQEQKTKTERNRASTTVCPTCGTRCYHQWSQQVTETYREITFLCKNEHCGHVFVASLAYIRDVVPSRMAANSTTPPAAAMAG